MKSLNPTCFQSLRMLLAAAAALFASATPGRAACPPPGPAAGEWRLTTRVTSAHSKAARGVNGYYSLSVTQAPDCSLQATLVKSGYAKKRFDAASTQIGTATLLPPDPRVPTPALANSWRLPIEIRSAKGTSVQLALYLFFDADRVDGVWSYRGSSWTEAGMSGGLLGLRGDGEQLALASTKALPSRSRCIAEHCAFDGHGSVACSAAYAGCASAKTQGTVTPHASRAWLQSPFALSPGGRPIQFRDGEARVKCGGFEGEPNSETCEISARLIGEADLVAELPGPEALVSVHPDEGYYGGMNFGSGLLILGVVNGRVATLAGEDFTKYGDNGLLGEVAVTGGRVVVSGDFIGEDDAACCPCHRHTSTYEIARAQTGYAFARRTRTVSRVPGDCGP
jgi:hypothetical protein